MRSGAQASPSVWWSPKTKSPSPRDSSVSTKEDSTASPIDSCQGTVRAFPNPFRRPVEGRSRVRGFRDFREAGRRLVGQDLKALDIRLSSAERPSGLLMTLLQAVVLGGRVVGMV